MFRGLGAACLSSCPENCSLSAAGIRKERESPVPVWVRSQQTHKKLMHIKNVSCRIAKTLDYVKRQSLTRLAVPSTSGKWEGDYFKEAGVMERFLLTCRGWSRSQLHTYGE